MLMTDKCPSFKLVTPFEYEKRGSHLSCQHENANEISKWMRKRNIYSDFISPDILIFAMTPLYTKFVDIWNAIENISDIVKNVESKTLMKVVLL
ncbi:hypothetical protein PVAND_017813 [Polypedilum vanderplanki]|uniref:Uncharacterized protein n=1 Tax=Polypedilum vanderplanki TaxID=319348 RepID=A0A9J6B9C4_POLVA|nr:hypothetical protein PVAND_017813 [Polypedilum vanderplanki]